MSVHCNKSVSQNCTLQVKKKRGWGVYAIAILFHFRHCGKSFAGETAAKFMKVQPGERSGTKTVSM